MWIRVRRHGEDVRGMKCGLDEDDEAEGNEIGKRMDGKRMDSKMRA